MALSQCASLCGMPQGWGRAQQDLHWNYLLSFIPNIEQGEMARVGNTTSLTPAPPVDSVPADAG